MNFSIKDLGEQGLLQLLRPFCSDRVGDDAALMGKLLPDCEMVVTTDILIDGVHFSAVTTSAEDAGWRAAAANLSDLAAMGATPWGVAIAIGLPPDTPANWIKSVYQGFTDCLKKYGTELVGGDTVRSPTAVLAVTAFGQVREGRAIQRHNARVGDSILITGTHGLSKVGLELLLHPELAQKLAEIPAISFEEKGNPSSKNEIVAALHKAHQRPEPRLDVPPLIWEIIDSQFQAQEGEVKDSASPSYRIAGMDSSDGLADAIVQICSASGVGARIDWEAIPMPKAIATIAGDRALDWVLYGGEDFELVLCLPPSVARALQQRLPSAAIVGEIIAEKSIEGLDMHNAFQHF